MQKKALLGAWKWFNKRRKKGIESTHQTVFALDKVVGIQTVFALDKVVGIQIISIWTNVEWLFFDL